MYPHRTFQFLKPFKGKLYDGDIPTLAELFQVAAARYPDKKCLTTYNPDKFVLTFKEARDKILTLAASLVEKGVKPGDRVVLTGKNRPEWAVAYYAIASAGAVIVPLDYTLHEEELKNLIDFSEPVAALVDKEKYNMVKGMLPEGAPYYALDPANENYVLSLENAPLEKPVKREITDLVAILYTSGTTGIPKGVMLSNSNLVNDCFLAQMNMQIYHTDVFYALLPVHHAYTMLSVLVVGLAQSAEVVFAKRLVVKEMLKDLKDGQITIFLGVPMLFNKLIANIMKGVREKGIVVYGIVRFLMFISGILKKFGIKVGKKIFGKMILDKANLSSIRICISGGGPLPSSTFRMFNQLGLDFVQGYGLTETSPIVTLNPIYHFKVKSVGLVLPEIQVKIINPDKEGRGEIALKGPTVMQGYYKNPSATDAVMDLNGYFYTGDMGYLDKENFLYLTGRKKNIIVTAGGKNVFPEEIEDRFQLYPEIEQILVRGFYMDGKKKQDIGEMIEALVYPSEELRNTGDPDGIQKKLEEIVNNVNRQLASYMKIARVRVVDQPFEESSTKKIKRYKVNA
ncbi:MAG: AMP-binding protein [Spirochaetia bacterium]|nr:AMP-binding protein [Spirochaetales bacterium]MBR5926969.1 AMP-binding protein [Spirochaetia bacterium]